MASIIHGYVAARGGKVKAKVGRDNKVYYDITVANEGGRTVYITDDGAAHRTPSAMVQYINDTFIPESSKRSKTCGANNVLGGYRVYDGIKFEDGQTLATLYGKIYHEDLKAMGIAKVKVQKAKVKNEVIVTVKVKARRGIGSY